MDFVYENETWKIWHLQYINDIDVICGQSWGKMEPDRNNYEEMGYPELSEFAPLKDYKMPEPTIAASLREYYHPLRPLIPAPEIPQAYETFSQTFSYGI